ncbi:hypothetical protein [Chthoniobacter flavus]|uniref:hypothetical protein n=1 Tax=Chthoniobacter flavus TaxID=191863 RepID=UPI0005B2E5DC|nr:hypothetical protein [Chthoniobacter flavus]
MKDLYDDRLYSRLEAILPGAKTRLETIAELEIQIAAQLAVEILATCCQAQNVGVITAGRRAFVRMPQNWINEHLPEFVDRAVNFSDDWEYRRFLEVLDGVGSPLLEQYCAIGAASNNPEIREVANDFSGR